MNPTDFQKDIPLFTVFILILIISANTLLPLFPCKFQSLLRDNMLMKHLINFAIEQKLKIIFLTVDLQNTNAIKLYQKYHFEIEAKKNEYFLMKLILK